MDSPEQLAEEWQALVDERPVGTLKVVTGLGFLARATVRHGQFVSRPLRERFGQLLRTYAALYGRVLARVSNLLRGDTRRGVLVHNFPAIGLFLLGAALGQWVIMLVAGVAACSSRFYTLAEKLALAVGVPVLAALVYAVGFWLKVLSTPSINSTDLLAEAASYFGTLPRIASLVAALFLSWRLAHGLARQLIEPSDV